MAFLSLKKDADPEITEGDKYMTQPLWLLLEQLLLSFWV